MANIEYILYKKITIKTESQNTPVSVTVMGVDPRKNVEGTLPSLVCSPLPLEVAPLKSS